LREGFPFQGDSKPAWLSTRQTLDGDTATTSASSIMNVSRRYPSSGFWKWKSRMACFSQSSSQKSRGTEPLCSLARP